MIDTWILLFRIGLEESIKIMIHLSK